MLGYPPRELHRSVVAGSVLDNPEGVSMSPQQTQNPCWVEPWVVHRIPSRLAGMVFADPVDRVRKGTAPYAE